MATRRIYQLAKEFEREEKEIIEFLTAQGIKVGNRLSAVSEDTYNMLKIKYTAPPPPPPEPEPEPEPVVEPEPVAEAKPAVEAEQTDAPAKKKKKKKKSPQPADEQPDYDKVTKSIRTAQITNAAEMSDVIDSKLGLFDMNALHEGTQEVYSQAIAAGNYFINNYDGILTKRQRRHTKAKLSAVPEPWVILKELKFDSPDSSPARYWQAVGKLVTRSFKAINEFGLTNREVLGQMRKFMAPEKDFKPREIFTAEENALFDSQQKLLFRLFSHGLGTVNDNLYELKVVAEDFKRRYEMMNFASYVTNPADELRCADRVPFDELVDAIVYSISGIVRRVNFYNRYKSRLVRIMEIFHAWIDEYAQAKEQGVDAAKLERYLWFMKKFIDLASFFAFDNLTARNKINKQMPFDTILDELIAYRQNMDDPDAERNFQYKVRGVTNIIHKPKEYIFIAHFANLQPGVDYRPPELKAAAEAQAAEAQTAEVAANEESPAESDEA